MKIALFIPLQFAAVGGRFLSAYLRRHGHEARLIFLPDVIPEVDGVRYSRSAAFECSDRLKQICLDLASDCHVVGFSVLAAFHEPMSQISDFLRQRLGKPVIWGGVHPSQFPKACLEVADWVCVGDGEETLVEFLDTLGAGGDCRKVPGLLYATPEGPVSTGRRILRNGLDHYPFPDYTFSDDWWVDAIPGAEKAVRLTPAVYRAEQKRYPDHTGQHVLVPYKTVASRGCPFFCSYCSMGSLDKKEAPFRKRSAANVIQELEEVTAQHGDMFDVVSMSDDTFLSHSREWIAEFAEAYRQRIGRPLRVIGFPESVTPEKITALCRAGAMHIGMGVESLSEKTLELYDRKTRPDRVIKAANVLTAHAAEYRMLPPTFDIILGNPYERRSEELRTFRRSLGIEGKYKVVLFHLGFLPGSKLYNRARADGLLGEGDVAAYRSWFSHRDEADRFLEALYSASVRRSAPRYLLKLLSYPAVYEGIAPLYARGGVARKLADIVLFDLKGLFNGRYAMRALRKVTTAIVKKA